MVRLLVTVAIGIALAIPALAQSGGDIKVLIAVDASD